MVSFFISLGGNVGDRFHYLKKAVMRLRQSEEIQLKVLSSIYETDPVGFVDQPPFLNMVVGGETNLKAEELLVTVLQIERELGRIREVRWGPRTIDIDILTYGQERFIGDDLEVPHPRMKDRLFVLIPFVEIAPTHLIAIDTTTFRTTAELLDNVMDKSGVRKWKSIRIIGT